MTKENLKKSMSKGINGIIKILPVILPIALIVSSNSAASFANGQPVPPESLKKYRKF